MTIRNLARSDVVTAGRDATATELAATMYDRGVGSVVVEDDGRPVGIVTDRDLAMEVLRTGTDPETTTAADVMTADPVTASVDAGVFEVTAAMSEAGVRRMPVVDGEELVGMLALDDLLVLLGDELRNLAGVVEAESPVYTEPPAD